jgi:hypothetical protein
MTVVAIVAFASIKASSAEDTRASRLSEFDRKTKKATSEKSARLWLEAADYALKNQLWELYSDCLKHAVDTDPRNPDAQMRLNKKLAGSDWLTDDEIFEREAKQKTAQGLVYYANYWGKPAQVEALRLADSKTVGWDVLMRVQSPKGYVTVYSNESLDITRHVAAITEATGYAYWEFYQSTFKLRMPPPLTVYLFKDKTTFDQIWAKASKQTPLPKGTAGVYSSAIKILFVHTDTGMTGESYLSTMAHEMVHAMDDRLAGILKSNSPNWLVEGRAEHIGKYARCGRVVIPGYVGLESNSAAAAFLTREIEALDLRQFLRVSEREKFGFPGYCLSFAFVHFLFHAENEIHAAAFRYFLSRGPSYYSIEDFEKIVGKIDTVEPAFKKYVNDFLLPGMIASQKLAQRERARVESETTGSDDDNNKTTTDPFAKSEP